VLDQSSLTNKYDIDLKWKLRDPDSLGKALLDQLGLEMAANRKQTEMLVVEPRKTESPK
jgi:uncharacterized protein (TIGR03435 family)